MVPILERTDIQTCCEEEADFVGDQLFIGVGIFALTTLLGAFLNAVENNFGGIGGRRRAPEDMAIDFKG